MVSIGKISTNPIYYVSQVAPGPEAYYSGSGEKPGTWVGRGCEDLNLSGEVTEDALGAVLGGKDPVTGDWLVTGKAASPGRLGGFDLTFSAPKGVSLLASLSKQQVAATVRGSHDAAVIEALAYLEDHATWARRGHNGLRTKATSGPKLAGKEPALDRGTKPLQTIRALFKVRDALVHPRPGSPTARFQYITDDDEKLIGPRVTGIYIVAVAGVMAVLDPLRPPAGPLPARRSDQQVPGCPRLASPGDWRDDRCTASGGSPTTGGAHNTGVASSGKRPQPLGSCSAARPRRSV